MDFIDQNASDADADVWCTINVQPNILVNFKLKNFSKNLADHLLSSEFIKTKKSQTILVFYSFHSHVSLVDIVNIKRTCIE